MMNFNFKNLANNRRELAKTISLIESDSESDRILADEIVREAFCSIEVNKIKAEIIAITGMPGAGKSTFINAYGLFLAQQGFKIAVLAIDPSSQQTFGAIMGDKTRMLNLDRHPNAYIRPSPSGAGHLGGISSKTEDVVLVLKAAGFDYIFIETIGVGQNETDASLIAEKIVMLIPPATGDEVQAVKRGNIEFVDLILVNKWDGETRFSAEATASAYRSSLSGSVKILMISSLENVGMDAVDLAIKNKPNQNRNKDNAFMYRLDKSVLSELLSMPEVRQLYDQVVSLNEPTRHKIRIFMNNLKKLLTKASEL